MGFDENCKLEKILTFLYSWHLITVRYLHFKFHETLSWNNRYVWFVKSTTLRVCSQNPPQSNQHQSQYESSTNHVTETTHSFYIHQRPILMCSPDHPWRTETLSPLPHDNSTAFEFTVTNLQIDEHVNWKEFWNAFSNGLEKCSNLHLRPRSTWRRLPINAEYPHG